MVSDSIELVNAVKSDMNTLFVKTYAYFFAIVRAKIVVIFRT